ncbi:unnamed protein product, partial [Oikopleura dioica]
KSGGGGQRRYQFFFGNRYQFLISTSSNLLSIGVKVSSNFSSRSVSSKSMAVPREPAKKPGSPGLFKIAVAFLNSFWIHISLIKLDIENRSGESFDVVERRRAFDWTFSDE